MVLVVRAHYKGLSIDLRTSVQILGPLLPNNTIHFIDLVDPNNLQSIASLGTNLRGFILELSCFKAFSFRVYRFLSIVY